MKFKDILNMDEQELNKTLTELKTELIKTTSNVSTGTTNTNNSKKMQLRKDIARIKTLIRVKEIERDIKGMEEKDKG